VMPGSRLNTKNRVSLKTSVLTIVIHTAVGAQIHMRDRRGETALAIAAQRGLRPAVKTLIELGASIHTTNYRGTSILSNARKTMRRAKETGNDNFMP